MKIKTIFNLTTNIYWKRSFGKFRKTIIIFFMIPVIIFDIVLAVVYTGKIKNEMQNSIDMAYMQTSMYIEEKFEMINNAYDSISKNQYIKKILTSDISRLDGIEATIVGGNINSTVNETIKTISCVKNVGIYSKRNDYLISSSGSGYINNIASEWYEYYKQNKKSDFVYSNEESIYICHGISIENDLSGILAFEIDKEQVIEELRFESYKIDIGIVLTSIDGVRVLEYGNIEDAEKSDMVYELRNETLNMTFVDGGGNIKEVYKNAIIYTLIYLVAGILAVFILSFLCSIYLYESLSNILARVDLFEEKGAETSNIKSMNTNVLANVSDVENIEERLAQSFNALQQAQLLALQMQINPHFVFNVLNYANSVILEITKCDNDAVKIIILLCNIFEYAMDEPKYTATIEQELEMAEKYIEIERLKTGLDFETVYDIDKRLLHHSCVKLFLQPIIENSVMHGIKRARDRKGKITIRVKQVGECIEFYIADNGKGIQPDKLEEIREQLKAPFEDFSKHIGMRNVNQRIKLFYGEEYGLNVNSDENGTVVTMKIPFHS